MLKLRRERLIRRSSRLKYQSGEIQIEGSVSRNSANFIAFH